MKKTETFGQRIRRLRIAKNMTQHALGYWLGIPASTLANWEQGRREPTMSPKNILSLAKMFDLTTGELLTGLKEENNHEPEPRGRPKSREKGTVQ
jgi:transcriptional regulator with XRE-family HTH domain